MSPHEYKEVIRPYKNTAAQSARPARECPPGRNRQKRDEVSAGHGMRHDLPHGHAHRAEVPSSRQSRAPNKQEPHRAGSSATNPTVRIS